MDLLRLIQDKVQCFGFYEESNERLSYIKDRKLFKRLNVNVKSRSCLHGVYSLLERIGHSNRAGDQPKQMMLPAAALSLLSLCFDSENG